MTLVSCKTQDSCLLWWKEELLRKPLMTNLSFAINKKRASQMLESIVVPQAMPTSLLACIASAFQTALNLTSLLGGQKTI